MDRMRLQTIREVQGQTGPNMCLASSKFLTLKLLGYVRADATLNDFLKSDWAKQHSYLPLQSAWGGGMATYGAIFNSTVLPAAINDASAGVKSPNTGHVRFHKGFTH